MPTLDQHQSNQTTKLLVEADSGVGKTGALLSLLLAGYKLYALDFDNGFDIIVNLIRNLKRDDLLKMADVYTLTDEFTSSGVHMVPKDATAWPRMVQLLGNWPGVGPIQKLGPKDILVLDSLNFAGRAAMRYVAKLNGRVTAPPQIQDYFDAQRMIENLCASLYDQTVVCNIIVLTHLREVSKTQQQLDQKGRVTTMKIQGTERIFPETGAGTAMSPTIGRFFNGVIMGDILGTGTSARRVFRTVPHENIGLKNPAPGRMPAEFELASGLAEYFAIVRGETLAPQVKQDALKAARYAAA